MIIAAIAVETLRRALRGPVPAAIGTSAGLAVLGMPLGSALSLGDHRRALVDIALTVAWLVASALAIALGAGAFTDLHDGRAALWLVRPVGRAAWALGRIAGLAGGAWIGVMATLIVVGALSAALGARPTAGWLASGALLGVEATLLTALAALLATQMRPIPAAFAAAGLWTAGHLASEYRGLPEGELPKALPALVFAVVPDLDRLDVSAAVAHGDPIDASDLVLAAAYGLAWTGALAALAAVAVDRQDVA